MEFFIIAVAMDSKTSATHEMSFSLLGSAAPVLAPRVGSLALAGRKTLSTPHYVAPTSRGAVPHIAHDLMRKETAINSLYIGLEDCTHPLSLTEEDQRRLTRVMPSRAEISH